MKIVARKSFLKGTTEVPGDKSISHRAVVIGAVARGKTEVNNFLDSEDTLRTIEAFRQMGVKIKSVKVSKCQSNRKKKLIIEGKGLYLKKPKGIIDAGNSGTTMRMLAGILAGQPFNSCITGDKSLRLRPMRRIIVPLRRMGAQIKARQNNYAPLCIKGGTLKSLLSPYKLEIASAQLKSCLLFAHLYTNKKVELVEPARSRDHTERMLKYFGADIDVKSRHIFLNPGSSLSGKPVSVPGDISSAVFFIVGAIITEGSKIFIKKVGINPTRSEILSVLKRMGADIKLSNKSMEGGEPVADILITPSRLKGISIRGKSIPLLIDEIPVLAVAATQAKGRTIIRNAGELRVKETDRIKSMVTGLKKMGADISDLKDGMIINGPTRLKGANLDSYGDHRTAMAFVIAGLIAEGETIVHDTECINTSFPEFVSTIKKLGGSVRVVND